MSIAAGSRGRRHEPQRASDIEELVRNAAPGLAMGGTSLAAFEGDLALALDAALSSGGVHVLNVHVDRYDVSPGLRRVTEGLSQRI